MYAPVCRKLLHLPWYHLRLENQPAACHLAQQCSQPHLPLTPWVGCMMSLPSVPNALVVSRHTIVDVIGFRASKMHVVSLFMTYSLVWASFSLLVHNIVKIVDVQESSILYTLLWAILLTLGRAPCSWTQLQTNAWGCLPQPWPPWRKALFLIQVCDIPGGHRWVTR